MVPIPTAASSHVQPVVSANIHHPLHSLEGSTSLVTGGARGIGLSLASALVSVGSHLVVLDILPSPADSHGEDEWVQLLKQASQAGLQVEYIHADITDEDAMIKTFARVASECIADGRGPLKTVVHAAAIMKQGKILDFSAAEVDRIMNVNVTGTFIITKAAALAMKQHTTGGSIVLMASISGFIANRGLFCSAYNSSKAAVHQFCRSASVELAEYGVRVNTISPGYIRSKMTDGLLLGQTELRDRWEGDNALQRMGGPEEIQGAVLYFATPASSYTTGTDIRIDGGHCAW
ncbi:Short-chain dehydrogenase/reductase SDR [Kalmanozyma brasiliensis GHG001]|uniref:Ketoreductase domain-containing protein n=1 Tax=Kalmanozyma brasiliensis (strain GHG001) TaxID=1365824 RepID=V5EVE8_KALBG|nr:Short-chain dehydrogenase/reductase SDR [Kalmanozyma brasiliensis GHG001]EST09450.1 Short-chain dehydrogenase/reductase SDR [Kalmanozyma brasiliensis GHG001]